MISNNRIAGQNVKQSCNSQNQEIMRHEPNNEVTHTMVVSDDEDSQSSRIQINTGEHLEPLDYRRDWSKEIIDTFENMKACLTLEEMMT